MCYEYASSSQEALSLASGSEDLLGSGGATAVIVSVSLVGVIRISAPEKTCSLLRSRVNCSTALTAGLGCVTWNLNPLTLTSLMPRRDAMRPNVFTYGEALPASYLPIMLTVTPTASANACWVIPAFSLAARISEPSACRQDCTLSLVSNETFLKEVRQFCIDTPQKVNYHVVYKTSYTHYHVYTKDLDQQAPNRRLTQRWKNQWKIPDLRLLWR